MDPKLHRPPPFPPVIDLSGWTRGAAEHAAISRQWDEAFSAYGCAVIVGHGVGQDRVDAMRQQASCYFTQPLELKLQDHHGPYGCPEGGYTPLRGEAVSKSLHDDSSSGTKSSSKNQKDNVESYVVHYSSSRASTDGAALPLATEYMDAMRRLLGLLHEVSSEALGLPNAQFFDKYFDSAHLEAAGKRDPSFSLRLAYYPPASPVSSGSTEVNPRRDSPMRLQYGAHTDYLTYTVLNADSSDWSRDGAGGLQVLVGDEWLPLRVPDKAAGGLIVNAGDLIQRWTNDRWISPVHRVVAPAVGAPASSQPRLSVVFFSGPLLDASISTLPGVGRGGDAENNIMKYEPVITEDYLMMKINPTATNNK